jgi:alpha-amylase/alpha-mannosidase (GH57 family)
VLCFCATIVQCRGAAKSLYLNIIWHQHQPLYVNPETDQLSGPWVRTHATKDYYDMAAILKKYPDVHCTFNLTSSLLLQLREYYLARLGPYVDTKKNTVDIRAFGRKWKGKTDPWIDLALKPTGTFTREDKDLLYRNAWNAFGISDVQIRRFPEYKALRDRLRETEHPGDDLYSEQEMREIKFWFYLAHFDPDFLWGPVPLEDGSVCDLSDEVSFAADSTFHLKKNITENDCVRMVAEAYKVMANVIPVHRLLAFSPETGEGQIEIITTPYCHPILPLVYDTDLARVCQPNDSLPPRFSYPSDADAQVAKGVAMYREVFGRAPQGMWPGEGAVAQPVLGIFGKNGIVWTASDVKVLAHSDPPGMPNTTPYRFPDGEGGWMTLVFRDTELSDRIGFTYKEFDAETAAEDFIQRILLLVPGPGDPDRLLTVILDGENAWEEYKKDIDGKGFLNALYRKLSALQAEGRVVTTTTSEYIHGNPRRGVAPHPIASLPPMKTLWPGSWINANFDTWIGEQEENTAWEYLLQARQDLDRSGVARPAPAAASPAAGTTAWFAYRTWEEVYAAEGSDWFWWYGDDQTAPGGDKPFDDAFLAHVRNIYTFARRAGGLMPRREFKPIIDDHVTSGGGQGTMAQSRLPLSVVFTCDARGEKVPKGIFIAGDLPQLGAWRPNVVAMRDDGQDGDDKAGDGIWSFRVEVPAGTTIHYKYTNSGSPGQWTPGEEFPIRNRTIATAEGQPTPLIIHDTFGR